MGAKITIDSATLMNKGLELIEAHHLFAVRADQLGVVVHPQQIVHAMVEYADGSVLAQMGSPDMRTPIAYSLAWPRRMYAPTERLDLTTDRHSDVRAAGSGALSGARLGATGLAAWRCGLHNSQCRQRDRRRGLSAAAGFRSTGLRVSSKRRCRRRTRVD